MTRTIATMFSGFEGVGVGARAAGYQHLWGVEWSAKLAGVAERNGFQAIVSDVCAVDYPTLTSPYHLHASPSCKKASIANSERGETEEDRETARAVVRALEALRPVVFTLENVRGYAPFDSFAKIIVPALKRLGYGATWDILNAADYGVPQTRERLILRAVLGQDRPLLPVATHARADKLTPMFDDRLPWVGWYAAIADLIPTLPPSAFAPWQLKRLPAEIVESMIFNQNESDDGRGGTYGVTGRKAGEPTTTIKAAVGPSWYKAFIVGGSNTSDVKAAAGVGVSMVDEPVRAVPADIGPTRYRAFVLDGESSGTSDRVTPRAEDDPAYTVSTSDGGGRQGRALLVSSTDQRSMPTREGDDPAFTVMAGSFDKSHQPGGRPRAFIPTGRVVSMTPRALARFQSFPDSYWLPDHKGLACEGIGNAVPPLLFQRIAELSA